MIECNECKDRLQIMDDSPPSQHGYYECKGKYICQDCLVANFRYKYNLFFEALVCDLTEFGGAPHLIEMRNRDA